MRCRQCKKSFDISGKDCGHHFRDGGVIDNDICSWSACDRFGDCMFFEQALFSKDDIKSFAWEDLNGVRCTLHHLFDEENGEILCATTNDGKRYILDYKSKEENK